MSNADWERRARYAALDYFKTAFGLSHRQAMAWTLRFVVAPSRRDMAILREEVEQWQRDKAAER